MYFFGVNIVDLYGGWFVFFLKLKRKEKIVKVSDKNK